MGAFQDRVITEEQELTEKLEKLQAFLKTPIFMGIAPIEQMRLIKQAKVMSDYQGILRERISAF